MEPSGDRFVDHREVVISAPKPQQMNARKVDITAAECVQNSEAGQRSLLTEFQLSVSKTEELKSCEDSRESTGEVSIEKSVIVQESTSTKSTESASTKTVKKYATTVYTQRIGGRKSRSSESDNDSLYPEAKPLTAALFGSSEANSPTEVSSVQFQVEAGMGSSTTTVLSKMFNKTVETTTEVIKKERHLSECSFSVREPVNKLNGQQLGLDQRADDFHMAQEYVSQETESQERMDAEAVFTEAFTSMKPEEEKEVAEYCPGLAIRTLALEDLQEKQLSSEEEEGLNSTHIEKSIDMSAMMINSLPSSANQERGFFSANADSNKNILIPVNACQESMQFSEHTTTQLLASESSSSKTRSEEFSNLTAGGQVLMQCTEDSSMSHRKPLFNPIEVERKFTMNDNTEEKLRSLGARLLKDKMFTDVYYDNDEFALIITDCWLRRRNDSWEAKVPLKMQKSDAVFAPASQYQEISNERDISTWLVDQLGLETWMRGDPIDLLVKAAGLTEFAKFTTVRRSYTLPSCVVDLLMTNNGLHVGEIDVMAASPEELPQALRTISNVAEQLGLSPLMLV